jgi:hypothetical protein
MFNLQEITWAAGEASSTRHTVCDTNRSDGGADGFYSEEIAWFADDASGRVESETVGIDYI